MQWPHAGDLSGSWSVWPTVIDDGTLDRARLILGVDMIEECVNAEPGERVRAAERLEQVDLPALTRLAAALEDPAADDVMRNAWR